MKYTRSFLVALALTLGLSSVVSAESGKAIYERKCSKCHGTNGDGNGRAGRGLDHKSTAFNDAGKMASISDERMFKAIKGGGVAVQESKEMEAYPTLSDAEIKDVIAYLRTFVK